MIHFMKRVLSRLERMDSIHAIYLNKKFRQEFRYFYENSDDRFSVEWDDRQPCLGDNKGTTSFDKHYTYHTAWAARKLAEVSPAKHVDISSLTYFSTLVSAFIPIEFYDYRPTQIKLKNMSCNHADITNLQFKDSSIHSLSCMHVVEHIGLGRYGDNLDVDGDLKAISELTRVMAKGGSLLFVVPIGRPKVVFNAHRIYSYDQIISYFPGFTLNEFTLIPDQSSEGLITDATMEQADQQQYGCGCFHFVKRGGVDA